MIKTASALLMTPQSQAGTTGSPATIRSKPKDALAGKASGDQRQFQCNEPDSEISFSSMPPNPKGSTFVICEICDAYIKDLSQLKSHMQHIHNVSFPYKLIRSNENDSYFYSNSNLSA